MGKNNINKFIALSSIHIANLNKVALSLNLQVIKNYVKNIENEYRECQLRVY